jgi:hypothetical protein
MLKYSKKIWDFPDAGLRGARRPALLGCKTGICDEPKQQNDVCYLQTGSHNYSPAARD